MKFAAKFNHNGLSFFPISPDDAQLLFNAVSSELFPKQLPLGQISDLESAHRWCVDRHLDWQHGTCFVWTCHDQALQAVGQITLLKKKGEWALAYWVVPERWGNGLATDMGLSLLHHLRCNQFKGKLWAGVHQWNKTSTKVLKKLGFELINQDSNLAIEQYSLHIT